MTGKGSLDAIIAKKKKEIEGGGPAQTPGTPPQRPPPGARPPQPVPRPDPTAMMKAPPGFMVVLRAIPVDEIYKTEDGGEVTELTEPTMGMIYGDKHIFLLQIVKIDEDDAGTDED